MKKATLTLTFAILIMGVASLNAQTQGAGFIDENLDGYNDLAPDTDGDGIPNGMDADFIKNSNSGRNFVDEDGDGFNDNALDDDGDGIINCEDEDYEGSARQGTGVGNGGERKYSRRTINEDGTLSKSSTTVRGMGRGRSK